MKGPPYNNKANIYQANIGAVVNSVTKGKMKKTFIGVQLTTLAI